MTRLASISTILLSTCLLLLCTAAVAEPLRESTDRTLHNHHEERETQHLIDDLSDETRDMLEQYQMLSRELEALRVYNDQLERLTLSQEEEKASIRKQMSDTELTQREIVPLMLRMVDHLDVMVAEGVPFLTTERQRRVDMLRGVMDRSDVAVAEKYRRALEAYQIELDYGRTIETYQGKLDEGGGNLTVSFLRVGRFGLYYQTLDGKQAAYWDAVKHHWQSLPADERLALRHAIRVARKQVAPDFLEVRVPVPVSGVEPSP